MAVHRAFGKHGRLGNSVYALGLVYVLVVLLYSYISNLAGLENIRYSIRDMIDK
jgi:hypothetical protein